MGELFAQGWASSGWRVNQRAGIGFGLEQISNPGLNQSGQSRGDWRWCKMEKKIGTMG